MDAEERQLEILTRARAAGRADGTGPAADLALPQATVCRDDPAAGIESYGPRVIRA